MTANGKSLRLRRALDRLEEFHEGDIAAFALSFPKARIRKVRDTWVVPALLGQGEGDADEVIDLLRVMRRSLERTLKEPVSILIEPDED